MNSMNLNKSYENKINDISIGGQKEKQIWKPFSNQKKIK